MNFKMPEFLQEGNGGTSFIRVGTFLVVGCVLFKNVYLTVKTGVNIELSMTEMGLILGCFGVKAWQKDKEEKVGNIVP